MWQMVPAISLTLLMVSPMPLIAVTALPVADWFADICAEISPVALAVWLASDLTSLATTAKPLPASPARAASIVALRARRLVWAAMSLISSTTSPILSAAMASSSTEALVCSASCAALWAISDDSLT